VADQSTWAQTKGAQPQGCRPPRGQGEQLREEILAAAERLLAKTEDTDAVSIRAVADAVGVASPSISMRSPTGPS
jgi:AcrR family transcriptional regulator